MSTKVKAQRSADIEAPAAAIPATEKPARAYLIDKVDEATGEVARVSRFRYLPGHPRQVRFDAKAGQFNIGGTVPLGNSLSFIPLAWRIFQDDILNMGRKLWAELFYADEKGAVCAVLFHGYSVENLYRLIEPLFYDDLTLADVVVKVQAEKKETTKEGKKATYYIAQFSYEPAPAEEVAARRDYARDLPIWRAETYTGAADMRIQHGYTVPAEGDDPHSLEAEAPAALPRLALAPAACPRVGGPTAIISIIHLPAFKIMFHNLQAYPGLTQAQHRALPQVSNTDLSELKAQVLGQLRQPNPQALAFGAHFHAATLEPATYARTEEKCPWPQLEQLARQVRRHRYCRDLLYRGTAELTHTATHTVTGVQVKIRPDLLVVSPAGRRTTLIDFKTTSCPDLPRFLASAGQYDYDRQAAFYLDALNADRFLIIGVQKMRLKHLKQTPEVWVFDATAAAGFIGQGRKKYTALLRRYNAHGCPP